MIQVMAALILAVIFIAWKVSVWIDEMNFFPVTHYTDEPQSDPPPSTFYERFEAEYDAIACLPENMLIFEMERRGMVLTAVGQEILVQKHKERLAAMERSGVIETDT